MIAKAVDYLKDLPDPEGKRRRMRLPVKLPVLYAFASPDAEGASAGECDFRQAMSVDLSAGGIQIEILDPPPTVADRIRVKDEPIIMKFDMPGSKTLLQAQGKVCWNRPGKAVDHLRLLAGIEFLPISLNSQIELISHAIGIARRKFWGKFSLIAGASLLVLSLTAGAVVYANRDVISRDLNASQRILQKMDQKVQDLARQKMELELQMEEIRKQSGR